MQSFVSVLEMRLARETAARIAAQDRLLASEIEARAAAVSKRREEEREKERVEKEEKKKKEEERRKERKGVKGGKNEKDL